MLIKTRMYLVALLLIVLSLVVLIYSIGNKNAAVSKYMVLPCSLGIVYLFLDIVVCQYFDVDVGLEILFFYACGAGAAILYAISLIINLVKKKKLISAETAFSVPASLKIITVLILVLPVLFISVRVIRDKIVVGNSDVIAVFESKRTGAFGAGTRFAFAIKGDSCKQFDFGIDYGMKKVVPKDAVRIKPEKSEAEFGEYKVILDNEYLTVLRADKEILHFELKKHGYYNNEIYECYYRP